MPPTSACRWRPAEGEGHARGGAAAVGAVELDSVRDRLPGTSPVPISEAIPGPSSMIVITSRPAHARPSMTSSDGARPSGTA
jgi:hypothetical protein